MAYRVDGLRELLRVTDQLPKDVKKGVRNELRQVAVPAKDEANRLYLPAMAMPRGRWHGGHSKTRYGISVRKAGTVSIEQRAKGKTKKGRRGNFTDRQSELVLDPTSRHAAPALEKAMGDVLDNLERKWLTGR